MTPVRNLKEMTIANLNRDDACEPGMAFVTPLIEAKDPHLNTKLFAKNPAWWGWAAASGYDVFGGIGAGHLGPQHNEIIALIERCWELTDDEFRQLGDALDAARDAAWGAARVAARYAAWRAARDAALDAAWDAARDAAYALVVRDLIGQHGFTQEHYDALTRPWRTVIGKLHPGDEDLTGETR